MPRFVLAFFGIAIAAILALVLATTSNTLVTETRTTTQPRSPAAPTVPPPALPKAVPGTKPESDTKSPTLSERLTSWWNYKFPSPPSVGSVPKVATPLPTVPPPPGAGPKTKLDEAIAEIEKKVRAKPADTESKSVPTVPPPPTASTPDLKSWVKGVLPTIPPPPSATTASLKGPSGSWGGFFSGFSGSCSVRGEEVELKVGETLKLTEGGSKECRVIYDASTESIIVARDGKGEFFLKSGVGRNPREVKLTAGKGYFKYSLCPANTGNVMLDWDCSPLN